MAEHVDFMRATEAQTQTAIMVAEIELLTSMLKRFELAETYPDMVPYLSRLEKHARKLRRRLEKEIEESEPTAS